MAGWDDVRRVALALPETTEQDSRGQAQWRVGGKLFVWERPLRKADIATLGSEAPDGEILAARVADLGAKDALIAADPAVYFTIPHLLDGAGPAHAGESAVVVAADEGERNKPSVRSAKCRPWR